MRYHTSLMHACTDRYALTTHPWNPGFLALRFRHWRYVYTFETHHASLYDLRTDPLETRNVLAQHPELARALATTNGANPRILRHGLKKWIIRSYVAAWGTVAQHPLSVGNGPAILRQYLKLYEGVCRAQ